MSKLSEFNEKLTKQLFHSRLLDMRLVKADSALRVSLAIYTRDRYDTATATATSS